MQTTQVSKLSSTCIEYTDSKLRVGKIIASSDCFIVIVIWDSESYLSCSAMSTEVDWKAF